MSQHSLTCLSQDIVVGVLNHLSSHIGITDLAFCTCGVLNYVVEVVDGVLKSVLNCTKCGTLGGYLLDCFFDGINCILSICVIRTINFQILNSKTSAWLNCYANYSASLFSNFSNKFCILIPLIFSFFYHSLCNVPKIQFNH